MNGDTNLSVYIFLFIYSIYIYRMPTMCLLWTTCDQRGRQVILSRLSGTSLWRCSWKLLNKLGGGNISVTFTSSCSKHYIEELPLFYFPFQIILHYFQSKFLRGYIICTGYRSIIKYVYIKVPNAHVYYENMWGKSILFNVTSCILKMTPNLLYWDRLQGAI